MISSPAVDKWRDLKFKIAHKRHEVVEQAERDSLLLAINGCEQNEIEQMIASLYPEEFPRFPEDWKTDDLCIGEHTYMSLIDKLINEVLDLRWRMEGLEK